MRCSRGSLALLMGREGECDNNPGYMLTSCCASCEGADDPNGDPPDWRWECGERGNNSTRCDGGTDLYMKIEARRKDPLISFKITSLETGSIAFDVTGTTIGLGPQWDNHDGHGDSSECPRLQCGNGTYVCAVAHDDDQALHSPSGASLVNRIIRGGDSLHVWTGGEGGTAVNDGSTSGGNNDMGVALCVW